jgi:hypothetical protein
LYVFRSSRNLLEVVAIWGEGEVDEPMCGPQQCWGLRQGQMYAVRDPQRSILCEHVHHARPYICLPMMAHGEVLALLHISPNPGITKVVTQFAQFLFYNRAGLFYVIPCGTYCSLF